MATEPAEYDAIAEHYKAFKQLPFVQFAEHYTLQEVLAKKHPGLFCGSFLPTEEWTSAISGLSILDLACGDGIYSRMMKRGGASEVLGVDLSPEMVALAEKAEAAEPLGCKFMVGDASKLDLGVEHEGRYDIILCIWLLNYAQNTAQLEAMVAGAFRYLKPGGRVVGINDWPENPLRSYSLYQPYGFIKVSSEDPDAPRKPGTRIEIVLSPPDNSRISFHTWVHPVEAYQAAFDRAGFADFLWLPPIISKEGISQKPPGYWDTLLSDPPFKALCATKPVL